MSLSSMFMSRFCRLCLGFPILLFAAGERADAQISTFTCSPGGGGRTDFDRDGDTDGDDWAALTDCLSGPGAMAAPTWPFTEHLCQLAFDLDDDQDVDLRDMAEFMQLFSDSCGGFGDCPEGSFVVHESGARGDPGLDTTEPGAQDVDDFFCLNDQTCDNISCSSRGTCMVLDGQAVCACDPGYAGADCEQCAVGYERQLPMRGTASPCILSTECRDRLGPGQGGCFHSNGELICVCDAGVSGAFCENGGGNPATPRPPTRVVITGTDASIARGDTVDLDIAAFGGGLIATDFMWELIGPGTLDPRTGSSVTYTAPLPDGSNDATVVEIRVCTASFPDHCATRYLTIDPPGDRKSTRLNSSHTDISRMPSSA